MGRGTKERERGEGEHSINTFALAMERRMGSIKMQTSANKVGEIHDKANAYMKLFSIKYLVHKLLVIETRFFISFIKIHALLNLSII